MPRARRSLARALLVGAVAAGGYLGWISSAGTPAPLDLLPAGADGVLEVRGAEGLSRGVAGTRFAAAFARSETRVWLERTEAVAALDSLRAGIGRVTGYTPGRGVAFDVVGSEAAAAWYPAPGSQAGPAPWVAGGRLSVRAWAAAGALRLVRGLGLGATAVGSERAAGRTVYAVSGGGQPLYLFIAGRTLLAGSDRALVLEAARAAANPEVALSRTPALRTLREALPAKGELFAWVRDPGRSGSAAGVPTAAIGVLVRAGRTIEVDVAAGPRTVRPAAGAGAAGTGPLPGVSLLGRQPLLFLSSREAAPPTLLALLAERERAVAARRPGGGAASDNLGVGRGYAIAVTGTGAGSGLFPAPQGLVMIGMTDAAAAGRALGQAFPADVRSTLIGSTRAFATRESFPLAGEFELWGAAVGPRLVFATDSALLAAVAAEGGTPSAVDGAVAEPPWRVASLASVSMDKSLPLLRRWSAPLSGLIGARWPGAPQVAGDLELLAAVGTVRLVAGADERFDRAAITLDVHDLP